MSAVLRPAAWTLALAALLPAIAREWRWWWPVPGSGFADYLNSSAGIIYATAGVLLVLAFMAFARRRRLILGALLSIMIVVQWQTQAIGWGRLVGYLAVLGTGALLLEVWRQNRDLYRQLKADQINFLRLIWQSIYLWSPLLVFILLGFWGNFLLLEASRQIVYDVTPVDRYCRATLGEGQAIIPCTGLGNRLTADQMAQVPVAQATARHVRDRFALATRSTLLTLPELSAEQGPDAAFQIAGALSPAQVLGLQADDDPIEIALQGDAQLVTLRSEKTEIDEAVTAAEAKAAELARGGGMFGVVQAYLLRQSSATIAALARQRALGAQIKARQQAVIASQATPEEAERLQSARVLRQELIATLRRETLDEKELYVRIPKAMPEDNAELTVYLLREMQAIEARTAKKMLDSVAGLPPALAYSALLVTPRCTTAAASDGLNDPDDVVYDANEAPITVNTDSFPCLPLAAGDTAKLTPIGLTGSTHRSIDRWQRERERAIAGQFRALLSRNARTAAEVRAQAAEVTDQVPRTIDLGRKSCHLIWRPGNCITNFVKGEAEDAYFEHRGALEDGTEALVADKTGDAKESVEAALLRVQAQAYETLSASADYLRDAVNGLQQLGVFVSALLSALLVLAVIKSFLYVLATRVFDARSSFDINVGDGSAAQGQYLSAPAIEIPRAFARPMITRDVLDNQDVSTEIAPWPFSAPLARIATGTYFGFNRGSHFELTQENMSFSRASGHDVIDWQMAPGEEVVFHYRNFFGASDNVRLKTTISLRLSTLLLGRLVFHSAVCTEGEGRLLLTSAGTVRAPGKTDSTTLQRLLAWNRHTRFRVASQGTMRSVLLDGYAIVRMRDSQAGDAARDGLIVVEAIREDRSKLVGSLKFIRNLMLPF